MAVFKDGLFFMSNLNIVIQKSKQSSENMNNIWTILDYEQKYPLRFEQLIQAWRHSTTARDSLKFS